MTNEPAFYMKMLHAFVSSGEEPDALTCECDVLAQYLRTAMHDAQVKALVLNDEVAARVFVDTMAQFVSLNLQKAAYQMQRCSYERKQIAEAAEWSHIKRRDNWQALVQMMDDKYAAQGFDKGFYNREFGEKGQSDDDALWQTLLNDWQNNLDLRLALHKREFLESRRELQNRLLHNNLKAVTQYVQQHGVNQERFYQSWALMGGRWNVVEYERLQQVVDFQRRYPVLQTITDRMGRVADALGHKRIGYSQGNEEQMQHASQSDITGISVGRDLGALLPTELAQYADADMEDVFLQKYVTGRLQTFDYQSHTLNAVRGLHTKPARPCGPMVVCVDMSGSMMGEPSKVALSLMMSLCEMCTSKRRNCYLIAFSVQAQPIDVLNDRTQLLQFFNRRAAGDTDARRALDAMFALLNGNSRYAGADVLWVTDFRIPLPPPTYFQQIERLRHEGTRFYGLQLGIAENHWLPYFDEMFKIEDIKMEVR